MPLVNTLLVHEAMLPKNYNNVQGFVKKELLG